MKKVLIIALVVCSLLVITMNSVIAADEEKTFVDPEDDVRDMILDEPADKPNIDLINITYSKTGKDVTLSLEVQGIIEDRGEIDGDTLVSYGLILYTNKQEYSIVYVNKECLLNGAEEGITCDKDDSTITFSFELENDDEIYAGLEVITDDMVIKDLYEMDVEWYEDDFSDTSQDIVVDAGGPYAEKVGVSVDFSGDASGGSPPYNWSWDFDDGNTSYEQDPTHTYEEAGEYSVTLTVTDDYGVMEYDTTTVVISADGDGDGDGDGGADDGTDDTSDEGDSSEDGGLLLFGAIIAIIAIIGIIAIIVIIRR